MADKRVIVDMVERHQALKKKLQASLAGTGPQLTSNELSEMRVLTGTLANMAKERMAREDVESVVPKWLIDDTSMVDDNADDRIFVAHTRTPHFYAELIPTEEEPGKWKLTNISWAGITNQQAASNPALKQALQKLLPSLLTAVNHHTEALEEKIDQAAEALVQDMPEPSDN